MRKRESEKLLFVVERATKFAFVFIKYALLEGLNGVVAFTVIG